MRAFLFINLLALWLGLAFSDADILANVRTKRHLFRARMPIYTGVHYAWQNPIRTAPTRSPNSDLTTENSNGGGDGRDNFLGNERNFNRPTGQGRESNRPNQGERDRESSRPVWSSPEPIPPSWGEREFFRPTLGGSGREPSRPAWGDRESSNGGREPTRPAWGDRESSNGDRERTRPAWGDRESSNGDRERTRPDWGDRESSNGDRERTRPAWGDRESSNGDRERTRPAWGDRESSNGGREPSNPTWGERQPFRPNWGERQPSEPADDRRPDQSGRESPSGRESSRPTNQRPNFGTDSQRNPTFGAGRESQNRNPGRPTFPQNSKCPAGTRLAKETGLCYQLGSRGPCNENMAFYQDPEIQTEGYCDCFQDFNRPLVYHRETDRCYFIFQQAYCQDREWLILDPKLNYHPMCDVNRCLVWTESNVPDWDWRFNGPELDMRGPVALLNEAFCVELQWPCRRESLEDEKITDILTPRQNEKSREDIVLKFAGPNLVCEREMSLEFPGVTAYQLLSTNPSTNTTVQCKEGLYNKMRSEGYCDKEKVTKEK